MHRDSRCPFVAKSHKSRLMQFLIKSFESFLSRTSMTLTAGSDPQKAAQPFRTAPLSVSKRKTFAYLSLI